MIVVDEVLYMPIMTFSMTDGERRTRLDPLTPFEWWWSSVSTS